MHKYDPTRIHKDVRSVPLIVHYLAFPIHMHCTFHQSYPTVTEFHTHSFSYIHIRHLYLCLNPTFGLPQPNYMSTHPKSLAKFLLSDTYAFPTTPNLLNEIFKIINLLLLSLGRCCHQTTIIVFTSLNLPTTY